MYDCYSPVTSYDISFFVYFFFFFFFFKQKTAYEMRISDWSSDVCSSDLRIRPSLGYRWNLPFRPRVVRPRTRYFHDDPFALRRATAVEVSMSFNPLAERGIPIEKQFRNWSELNVEPYDKDAVHPFSRCRGIDRKSTRLNSSH